MAGSRKTLFKYILFLAILSIVLVSATTAFAIRFLGNKGEKLGVEEAPPMENRALALLGIGIAFGAAAIGAGIGIHGAGSAGLSAAAERPELSTLAIIITALAEAIAIYGLVVVILMLAKV